MVAEIDEDVPFRVPSRSIVWCLAGDFHNVAEDSAVVISLSCRINAIVACRQADTLHGALGDAEDMRMQATAIARCKALLHRFE
mmetsp:Transcript_42580/g.90565  ORF Transcript_42580/g.90565 Transcript_42580/m.90565 type:complete len:84 (-) Transcript_42580:962-1213(-)